MIMLIDRKPFDGMSFTHYEKKCENDGCVLLYEFENPRKEKICSDCIQRDVEIGEYSWDECKAI